MKNLFLDQIGDDDFKRLEPYLKIMRFKQHSVLFDADQEIKHVYFPTGAVVSLVVALGSGKWSRQPWLARTASSGHRQRLTDALLSAAELSSCPATSSFAASTDRSGCTAKSQTAVAAHSS